VKRVAAVALVLAGAIAPARGAAVEESRLRIALAGSSAMYLPFWLATDRLLREEGVTPEVAAITSGGLAQAVASGSVDVGVSSLSTLILTIAAGQPVVGFYAGFSHADAEWFARPEIRRWADLRGRRVAISGLGGLSETLTVQALRRNGLEPGTDVALLVTGGVGIRLQALQAGRVDAAMLEAPAKWEAEARGFTRLGTQRGEIGPEWPRAILWTRTRLLDERPASLRALLRAHVRAIRLIRTQRELAVRVIEERTRYRRDHAERAYEEVLGDLDERGRLPRQGLTLFWQAAVARGEVAAPWPEARFFDRRFVDSFDEWAPR
jgi:ABC-type nitrate/sulfonate/bicarbonate transport system substrate-binding protein